MRLSLLAGIALLGSAISQPLSPRAATDPSTDLADWVSQAIEEFQPSHPNWQTAYDKSFSPSLTASFNATQHNFTTLKLFYTAVEGLVGTGYSDFTINTTSIVAVPNSGDIGGRAYVLGVEGGHRRSNGELVTATDGAFAVVGVEQGERKIVEWRESTNLPSS